jgi:uncharacterized delta-60 repeat protein
VGTVVRLLPDGSLDAAFGTGGIRTLPIVANSLGSLTSSLALQPDGKAVMAGWVILKGAGKKDPNQYAVLVARCTATGAMDTTFGSGGITVYDPNVKDDLATVNSMGLQSNGKVVVGVRLGGPVSGQSWCVVRFLATGVRDTAFGVVTEAAGAIGRLGVDASDRIVAVGNGPNGGHSSDVILRRYLVDGARDTAFGSGGTAFVGQADANQAGAPAFQADGKVVVVVNMTAPQPATTQAVRLLEDGTLDTGFGAGGYGQPVNLAPAATIAWCIEVMPDGGIVLGGFRSVPGTKDLLLARYLP